jgi:hypothetical protein
MCRNTFRISCLNATAGAAVRSSERINPVNAGMRPTAHLPTYGPLQKGALVAKAPFKTGLAGQGICPIQPMFLWDKPVFSKKTGPFF